MSVETFKATDLHTFNGAIAWYGESISTKRLKKDFLGAEVMLDSRRRHRSQKTRWEFPGELVTLGVTCAPPRPVGLLPLSC